MNKEIINYFQENKDQRTKEELIEELKQKGFKEDEINEGVKKVYLCGNPLDRDFWDFKTQKTYCSSSEKVKDFLLGFFGAFFGGILLIIPALGLLVYIILYLYFLFSFFNKRRWISLGILFHLILNILILAYLLLFTVNNVDAVVAFLEKFLP